MIRSPLALVALGALALPATAHAAPAPSKPTLFKVVAYGVQRYSSHSTVDWEEGCRGERGETSLSLVIRFKTPKAWRVRLVRYGTIATLQPATKREWIVTGSGNARATVTGEKATCAAVNPDGSIRWFPEDPVAARCSDVPLDQEGDVDLEGRKLSFTGYQTLLAPLSNPLADCKSSTEVLDLAVATARISPKRIVASDGEPIVLRFRDEGGSASDTGHTEWKKRMTAYVTFTPVR
ncbi:MAG TPA: hypothetical protein VFR97_03190 [Capillimicrobium sp.]|nr:hypothetical protein [Capillimicrobium sp.]